MAAAAEHCEPEALTHAKISLSNPNFMYILVRHINTIHTYRICKHTYVHSYAQ